MVDTNFEALQALANRNYNLDLQGALRKATGLRLDVYGIVRRLYGKANEPNEVFTQLQQILSNRALLLDGTSGCFCSTPDAATLDIVGDIDIRIEFVDTFNSIVASGLVAKWTAAGQQSYRLLSSPLINAYQGAWSSTGSDNLTANSANLIPLQSGALRLTVDVDNGASGRTIRFFTSPTLGTGTQFGADIVQGGVTSIFASTAALVIGSSSSGGTTDMFRGRVTRMELRNSVGTVVANPDFRALSPGTTSFQDAAGLTWTLQGTARIV